MITIFVGGLSLKAQCTECTHTSNGTETNVTLSSGDVFCIPNGVNFTGSFSNAAAGSVICIAETGDFHPSGSFNGFYPTIRSYKSDGVLTLPNFSLQGGMVLENYGKEMLLGSNNINGVASIYNYSGVFRITKNSFAFNSDGGSIYNADSLILVDGFATGTGSVFTNDGWTIVSGAFNPNGTVINNGLVTTTKFININSSADVTNECDFYSEEGFNNNTNNVVNNGLIYVNNPSTNSDGWQNNTGKFTNGADGIIHANRFVNSAEIVGGGDFYIGGNSSQQGDFGLNPGDDINFWDTDAARFDVESNTTQTGSGVTYLSIDQPVFPTVFASCSQVIKDAFGFSGGNNLPEAQDSTITIVENESVIITTGMLTMIAYQSKGYLKIHRTVR